MSWKLFFLLVKACGLTIAISAVAIVLGLVIGTLVSGAMLSRNPDVRADFADALGR